MPDQDKRSRVERAYEEAEGVLHDAEARAARRARVLANIAAAPAGIAAEPAAKGIEAAQAAAADFEAEPSAAPPRTAANDLHWGRWAVAASVMVMSTLLVVEVQRGHPEAQPDFRALAA